MATVQVVCAQLQTYMLTLTGIRGAPALPPDNINAFPFAVCHAVSGNVSSESYPNKRGLHKIAIDVHVSFKDTAREFGVLMPYLESVTDLLYSKLWSDDLWNGTIDTFESVDYTFVQLTYGGVQTHALQFVINGVKIRGVIS